MQESGGFGVRQDNDPRAGCSRILTCHNALNCLVLRLSTLAPEGVPVRSYFLWSLMVISSDPRLRKAFWTRRKGAFAHPARANVAPDIFTPQSFDTFLMPH